jgi:hypothetical protein
VHAGICAGGCPSPQGEGQSLPRPIPCCAARVRRGSPAAWPASAACRRRRALLRRSWDPPPIAQRAEPSALPALARPASARPLADRPHASRGRSGSRRLANQTPDARPQQERRRRARHSCFAGEKESDERRVGLLRVLKLGSLSWSPARFRKGERTPLSTVRRQAADRTVFSVAASDGFSLRDRGTGDAEHPHRLLGQRRRRTPLSSGRGYGRIPQQRRAG